MLNNVHLLTVKHWPILLSHIADRVAKSVQPFFAQNFQKLLVSKKKMGTKFDHLIIQKGL